MATVPDFGALADRQYGENLSATRQTNLANRPNQYGPMGSTTWGMNPDGTWTQNSSLNGGAQSLFDNTLGWQSALGSTLGAGAPQASFGAQQNVIDAWNALQQPGLDKQAAAMRNRAAAMGITGGSTAMNDVERTIGTNAATSRNQGILQGVNAYSDMYKNQLAGYNANQGAMTAMTGVRDSLNPNKWNPTVPTSAAYMPKNAYGAAADTFAAQQSQENQATAGRNSLLAGGANLLQAAGGLQGVGSAVGNIYSWGKDIYNNWGNGGTDWSWTGMPEGVF